MFWASGLLTAKGAKVFTAKSAKDFTAPPKNLTGLGDLLDFTAHTLNFIKKVAH